MRKILILFIFLLPLTKSVGQEHDKSLAEQFITQMYNDRLYEDYDFLQKHCSAELLKKLQDAYPYETDDTAYATWLFRSGQQDSKPKTDAKTMVLEVTAKDGWYTYRALDMGWEFTRGIKLTCKDGLIIIEDLDMCMDAATQELPFSVKETRITREEFVDAYQHRLEYNHVRDTTLSWSKKKQIEVAVFRTLTDEEKEEYIWTNYGIDNIGQYPTGEYIADLGYANWMGAVFVDENFQADSTTINGNDRAAYSKTGIYVGCRGFDCDDIAWLHFYRHKDGNLARMEEIAEHINNNWRLPWYEDFPEFDGLDFNNAMVWYKDALYCFGVENYDDENGKWCTRPIYLKLELIPIK